LESTVDSGALVDAVTAGLHRAADASDLVANLLADRGDLSAGLAALAVRWADTDGLVRAQDAVLPGATVHDLTDVAHHDLPRLVPDATGLRFGAGTVAVTCASDDAGWPIDAGKVLDLSAAGLVPSAFDLFRLSTEDGPWLVLLPDPAAAT